MKLSTKINKLSSDGYVIFYDAIPKELIKNFNSEILKITNSLNKKSSSSKKEKFDKLFVKHSRHRIYKLMQNLNSVRKITHFLEKFLDKAGIFNSLKFRVRSLTNGLIISIPREEKNLNPAHQDIYSYNASTFVKLWVPMTKVDKFNGSMKIYKKSHKLGFVEPKYVNNQSTYPEINKTKLRIFTEKIFDFKPGSFVLFNPLVVHESVKNKSKKTRFTTGIDIQNVSLIENEALLKKMDQIKKERSRRRKIFNK